MTKTIKICDKCKREVKWLFEFNLLEIKGFKIEVHQYDKYDLCPECAKKFIDMYNHYADSEEE
jgi:hypothetical protein